MTLEGLCSSLPEPSSWAGPVRIRLRFAITAAAACCLGASAIAEAQIEVVPRAPLDTTVVVPDTPRDTTPWIPRDSVESEVRHVVKPGDTLWDLAQHYLNDPFRWPDVFRRNTDVVEDPHWIYPGEVLRIPVEAVRPGALSAAREQGFVVSRVTTRPVTATAPGAGATVFGLGGGAARTATLAPLDRSRASGLRRGEVDVAPFVVGRRGPAGAGTLVGTAERPAVDIDARDYRFQLYDHAYIELPEGVPAGVGENFLTLVEGADIIDTARLMVPTGILRVVAPAAGERPARARLVRQFGEVLIGQRVILYDAPPDMDRLDAVPVTSLDTVSVLWVHNDPVLPSLQHYVILSLPRGTEVRAGDRFTLIDQTRLGAADPESPPEDAALVQVVRVTPFAATAIVVAQRLPTITRGMRARLTARLR